MANIKTGSIVSDIRGKVGTEIYSRNKGGAYVKDYTSPVQPDTTLQTDSRALMATAVAAWQGLSDNERQSWNQFASTYPWPNKLGEKVILSGYQTYLRRKLTLLQTGESAEPIPIAPNFSTEFTLSWFTITTASLRRQYSCDPQSDVDSAIFFLSPPVSAGVTSINSVRLVQAPFINDVCLDGTSGNFLSNYLSLFGLGSISAGDRIFLAAKCMNLFNTIGGFQASKVVGEYTGPMAWISGVIQSP